MRGYGERKIFTEREVALRADALRIVEPLPWRYPKGDHFRCHEVTRVVASILDRERKFEGVCADFRKAVRDGQWASAYEHSWIELPHDKVLDVYAVGKVPQVQLVHIPLYARGGYNGGGGEYRSVWPRDDIRDTDVAWLITRYERWVNQAEVAAP